MATQNPHSDQGPHGGPYTAHGGWERTRLIDKGSTITATTVSIEGSRPTVGDRATGSARVVVIGNPNAGKTTLFNALTGLRAKTANFPGTTVERRVGRVTLGGHAVQLIDLPGLYSLAAATPEEKIARDVLMSLAAPRGPSSTGVSGVSRGAGGAGVSGGSVDPLPVGATRPAARPGVVPGMTVETTTGAIPGGGVVVVILDATNLERNLYLVSQVLELGLPTVVALNMTDLARRQGITLDAQQLGKDLGCAVVPIVARTREGVEHLRYEIESLLDLVNTEDSDQVVPGMARDLGLDPSCGCQHAARYQWADQVAGRCVKGQPKAAAATTEAIDRVLTHPVIGVGAFLGVMLGMFALIFWLAQYPMGWIDSLFGGAGELAAHVLPEGAVRSLVVEGVIGGVGGMLVFLPQICILFFFLSLLEDTGYLARAAFVMDRVMGRVGLPGKAFVPLLSSHACAIPGIMAARVIEDRRDRLVTILVAPLMTCSARIPVYAMVTALLFPDQPLRAAVLFTAAYSLGIVAALVMAFAFKHTILRGESQPLVLELPSYKVPSLRNALITAIDRAGVFVRKAGTVILAISIVLWWLASYPTSQPPPESVAMQATAQQLLAEGDAQQADELTAAAEQLASRHALGQSAIGRLGRTIEPVIRPLGFDWQIGIGLISSFAAREVIVSTLAVVYGVGADTADENPDSLYDTLRSATRNNGSPVFTTATCLSLLVFYVLAMQCLPTQAVTRRETQTWKWPIFQLVYMTVLAYTASLVTYQLAVWLGAGGV